MTIKAPWPDCPRCPGEKMGAFLKGIPNQPIWRCQWCGYERERLSGEGLGEIPPSDAELLVKLRAEHEEGTLFPAAPEIDLLFRIIDAQKGKLRNIEVAHMHYDPDMRGCGVCRILEGD